MASTLKKFALISSFIALATSGPCAAANPIGDFFKKVGHSISNLHKSPPPRKNVGKTSTKNGSQKDDASASKEDGTQWKTPVSPTVTPTPTPVDIRPAASAPPDLKGQRDVPYGVAVPNKPGFVTSPYAPNEGFVDVRAFPSSTEVMDPFTGKIFLTP